MKVEKGQIYKHYKFSNYVIICVAKHSENLDLMVVYKLLGKEDFWVRPLTEWFEEVINSKGEKVSRFTLL